MSNVELQSHNKKISNSEDHVYHDFIDNGNCYVCEYCGLISDELILQNVSYSKDNLEYENTYKSNMKSVTHSNFKKDKILKMQEWYMWSNEEKNIYKLKLYVIDLCKRLNIVENLVDSIVDTVVFVMNIIKKNDGTKRARVKDGIIICCIQYVSKDTNLPYSSINLAKILNLEIKYVTKAEKIILELINFNKLKLDKSTVLECTKPYEYVRNIINKNNLKVQEFILDLVKRLISICEENDILLNHTPLSIGVSCFYYILQKNNIEIDLKMFSELYDISVVTVTKAYNKIKIYDKQINNILKQT